MDKRMYSLNLMAYVYYSTQIAPILARDELGTFYGIFPENDDVTDAIREYRDIRCSVNLHVYLKYYKAIKEQMRSIRGASYGIAE